MNRTYSLVILAAVYGLNLVDRNLMTLLLQPIKQDLQLSDTQLGFITGIAFGLFYAILGLPIARWADRGNRVNIAAVSIGLWGLTVMAALFVANYAQLVAARVMAAVGEAGCKPPTYSLVGDYFPEARERTRAMSVYWLGGPVAALLSFGLGGWLAQQYGWRVAFFVMGIPGLILAVVLKLTLRETRTRAVVEDAAPMRAVMSMLWRQTTSRHLLAAMVLLYTLSFGMAPWYGAFLMRSHGIGAAELGLWLGLVFGLGQFLSILAGGWLANRFFAGNDRGQLHMSGISVALLTPFFAIFLLVPEKYQALLALAPLQGVWGLFVAPVYAMLQRLVPDAMRATTLAIMMLLANLVGMGIGPQIVGIASDVLQPRLGDDSLRYAMLICSVVALWSGWHFWRAGATVTRDLMDK